VGNNLPGPVSKLLQAQLGGNGSYDLSEVALIAATIEATVHAETTARMSDVYRLLGLDAKSDLSWEEASAVASFHLKTLLLGMNTSGLSVAEAGQQTKDISQTFPYWSQVRELVGEARQQVQGLISYRPSDVSRMVQYVVERLGHRLAETNCKDMRKQLLKIEEHNGTGRARLRDFYTSAVSGDVWQFQENLEFLRQMGVLDESDISQPRVIMANYLYMHADCIQVSDLHELCCTTACEGLMSFLERSIQAPHATAKTILGIVSTWSPSPSSTNGTLAPALVNKLEDIASHHGGVVPLYGRLFSQWLHFAYPHDCPYPHVSGTTQLLNDFEWREKTGRDSWWSEDEMKNYVEVSQNTMGPPTEAAVVGCDMQDPGQGSCPLTTMWVHEEELLDTVAWNSTRTAKRSEPRRRSFGFREVMLLTVLFSCALSMWQRVRYTLSSLSAKFGDKSGSAAGARPGAVVSV